MASSSSSSSSNAANTNVVAPAAQSAAAAAGTTSHSAPRIPLSILDGPTQRVYAVAITGAVQAYKLYVLLHPASASLLDITTRNSPLSAILFLDFASIFTLAFLRVPRIDYRSSRWVALFCVLAMLDWTICGGWKSLVGWIPVGGWLLGVINALWTGNARAISISEHRVRIRDLIAPDTHISGRHTVHFLPYSTARFNFGPGDGAARPVAGSAAPPSNCYCVGPSIPQIVLPILFNNTEPAWIQYSVVPFDAESEEERYRFNVTVPKADLTTVGKAREHAARTVLENSDDFDDGLLPDALVRSEARAKEEAPRPWLEERPKGERRLLHAPSGSAERTLQYVYELRVAQVGRIRLERVVDSSGLDARISRAEASVVECPSVTFGARQPVAGNANVGSIGSMLVKSATRHTKTEAEVQHQCPASSAQLDIVVRGAAPLGLVYASTYKPHGRKASTAHFPLSHIAPLPSDESSIVFEPKDTASGADAKHLPIVGRNRHKDFSRSAQEIPLSVNVNFERAGTYTYALENVTDVCGNTYRVEAARGAQATASSAWKRGLDAKSIARLSPASLSLEGLSSSKEFEVHPRVQVAFGNCSADKALPLRRGGHAIRLRIDSVREDGLALSTAQGEGPWEAQVSFVPDASAEVAVGHSGWTRNVTIGPQGGPAFVEAAVPGSYTVESVCGKHCAGLVSSPWACSVIDVPPPRLELKFTPITDNCAGPVGAKFLALLSGTPPFELAYSERAPGRSAVKRKRTIQRTREEIDFVPQAEGTVGEGEIVYEFLGLSDENYKDIPLGGEGYTFKQDVHPLANAVFVRHKTAGQAGEKRVVMHSCVGDTKELAPKAEVELSGTGPFDLTYAVRSASADAKGDAGALGKAKTQTIKRIASNKRTIDLALPSDVAARGGTFTVSLVSIRDARGCSRPLATADLVFDVRSTRPTVGFVAGGPSSVREVRVLEGASARLALRLEGQKPWSVTYERAEERGAKGEKVEVRLDTPDAALVVDRPGYYVLRSVRDAHCGGDVLETRADYTVAVRPRPGVQFVEEAGRLASNGSLMREAVCRGTPDAAELVMHGVKPVKVAYEHRGPYVASSSAGADADGLGAGAVVRHLPSEARPKTSGGAGGKSQRLTLSSAFDRTSVDLVTAASGWHVYDLMSVGDATYEPASLPRDASARRLEQMVYAPPSASLSSTKGTSFCLYDALGPRGAAQAATVQLQGVPPFSVDLELRNDAQTPPLVHAFSRSGVAGHAHNVELPREDFNFSRTGTWALSVRRVTDGHGCAADVSGQGTRVSFEVAETASIAPVGSRGDYCVGDAVEFGLKGTPPWSITWTFNSKRYTASTHSALFSRIADKAGVMRVERVAHQQNKCGRSEELKSLDPEAEGLVKTVHPLPSVRVSQGSHFIEDLREGTIATIHFELKGSPPFAFTYRRTQPADKYSDPRVLEEDTVETSDSTYTIQASQEGTWSVTWLRDRWCAVSLSGETPPFDVEAARLRAIEG